MGDGRAELALDLAARWLGELLGDEKSEGHITPGQPRKNGSHSRPFSRVLLNDIGVSKDLSSRSQKLAAVPAEVFEAKIAEAKDDAKELEFTTFADRAAGWRLVCEVMRLQI